MSAYLDFQNILVHLDHAPIKAKKLSWLSIFLAVHEIELRVP
jgi:hypothetical protein